MSITKKIELVPTMTSNTSAGVAFGSGVLSTSYNFFMAFDKNVATAWCSNSIISHLGYNFNKNTYLNAYSLTCRNLNADDLTSMVSSWTFEGSNDGTSWTVLDTQNGHTWTKSQEKLFNLSTLVNYSQYRVNIAANNGYAGVSSIGEFNLIWFKNVGIALKNPTTDKNYSLSDNTLIHLPNASNKNMILFGMEQGKEVQLDVPLDRMKYIQDTSEALDVGRTFRHEIEVGKEIVQKVIL